MKAAIWTHELFDESGTPRIGGVQTYILELAKTITEAGGAVEIVTPHVREMHASLGGIPAHGLPSRTWRAGVSSGAARDLGLHDPDRVHIVANAHAAPRHLGRRSVGIQHGIYWDRPAASAPRLSRLAARPLNLVRTWRGAAVVNRYARLVCVDWTFPTMAACVFSPLPWSRIHCIPNFAPESAETPRPTPDIRRIVFSRRFERHRGTRLLAEALTPLLRRGWDGTLHLVGQGPEEAYLREAFVGFDQVRFDCLPFERRMEAFTESSLVVNPSLSTEGTSLTCIEGMSRGALVLATGVGGLANLIIPGHNGLLVRPTVSDLQARVEWAVRGGEDVARMKRNALETFRASFSRRAWRARWLEVLELPRPAADQQAP